MNVCVCVCVCVWVCFRDLMWNVESAELKLFLFLEETETHSSGRSKVAKLLLFHFSVINNSVIVKY